MKQKKTKNCENCGVEFKLFKTTQKVCSWKCHNESKIKKDQEKKVNSTVNKSDQTLTIQSLVNLCQVVFNKYIRLRDTGKPCVSCLDPYQKDFHAGHLHPAGNCWKTRFDEKNVWGQCPECNTDKAGNLDEYRINILFRISAADLSELDQLAKENANFSREFLLDLIQDLKEKTEKLEKKRN